MHQPQVVPDTWISRVQRRSLLDCLFRLRQSLLVQERNSLVENRYCQRRVSLVSLIESGRGFFHELLVHHGDTQVVQLSCLGLHLRVVSPRAYGEQTNGDNAEHEPAERLLHSGCLLRDNGEGNLDYKVQDLSRPMRQPQACRSGAPHFRAS